jgi:hypothetical protein
MSPERLTHRGRLPGPVAHPFTNDVFYSVGKQAHIEEKPQA